MTGEDDPRDANGYRYADYPAARDARTQKILNTSWPFEDKDGRHARGLKDQPAENQRPCWVSLVFERDGHETLPGLAVRWNRSHVLVSVDDPRVTRPGVWVRAHDVRPRDPAVPPQ